MLRFSGRRNALPYIRVTQNIAGRWKESAVSEREAARPGACKCEDSVAKSFAERGDR